MAQLRAAQAAFLTIWGMDCPECARRIRQKLLSLDGVLLAEVYLEQRLASAAYDPKRVTPTDLMIIARGWRRIHRAKGELVTDGIYAFVRHPQYLGLFLLIASLLIQWPTILSVLMAPALFLTYVRLARREEREMESQFGDAYLDYKARVPAFLPPPMRGTLPASTQTQDATAV